MEEESGVGVEQLEIGKCVFRLLHSPRELDSGAVGLNLGRIQRSCIVSCLTPMSVRVFLSALARLIFPDGKVVGCLGTLGPLVDCVDIWIPIYIAIICISHSQYDGQP